MKLGFTYLLHMWVPILTVLSMARCLQGHVGSEGLDVRGMQALSLGVFVVYTGDRLLEHGHHWGRMRRVLWVAVGVASILIGLRILGDPPLWSATAVLGALSLSYLALKPLAVVKTLVVGLTWTIGCAVLAHAPQPGWDALWTPAAGALLSSVCAGAVLCDLKDAERDRMAGVRSLPTLLGERGATRAAGLLALGAAGIAASVGAWGVMGCALAMAVLSASPTLVRKPVTGPLTVDLALAVPGAVLFALQDVARR